MVWFLLIVAGGQISAMAYEVNYALLEKSYTPFG